MPANTTPNAVSVTVFTTAQQNPSGARRACRTGALSGPFCGATCDAEARR
ncbi:hypothetical protein LMG29542_01851 [Paraburkholderia humisilvae]|uniref:Uncharacterized protein n=1 Tax=Paraburkholderia humisilvae TaxID=627669 RepID=A0A6J5DGR3_9BURK|nr:hypothetical protein LMG29542_01851 [Paraburkholderia humisilvae]